MPEYRLTNYNSFFKHSYVYILAGLVNMPILDGPVKLFTHAGPEKIYFGWPRKVIFFTYKWRKWTYISFLIKRIIWSLVTGKGKIHVNKTKLCSFFTYHNIALHCICISWLPQTSWIREPTTKKGYITLHNFELNIFLQLKFDETLNLPLFALCFWSGKLV